MRSIKKNFYFFCLLITTNFILTSITYSSDSTFVERHGLIKTEGNKLVDKNGNAIVLRGMSLFWSQWMPQFYNYESIEWLFNDWKCTVIRAAMGIESGGYLTNPVAEKAKIKTVIEACISLGIYVIVDWHDHNAQNHLSESIEFFEEIAREYGDEPNIIYEIFNEPQQVSWNTVVKPYADSVIKHIRAIDPDNLIIVGTPNWSQYVDEAANNPLSYNNIAYALHFYAATHKQWLRDRAKNALNKGVALFVSEFGTSEASGDGKLDSAEVEIWMKFMEDNKLSWCNWSIADKNETSAALKPGASRYGGWSLSDLTKSGLMIRDKIIFYNTPLLTSADESEIQQSTYPKNFELYPNYPNPFNPTTTITFSIPKTSSIKLEIFNSLGEKVATLIDKTESAGNYKINWDAHNFSNGVYLCRLYTDSFVKTIKMLLIK